MNDRPLVYACANWSSGIWGVRVGRFYATLAAPWRRPLYSERHRKGMKVLPLGFGWRMRLRTDITE